AVILCIAPTDHRDFLVRSFTVEIRPLPISESVGIASPQVVRQPVSEPATETISRAIEPVRTEPARTAEPQPPSLTTHAPSEEAVVPISRYFTMRELDVRPRQINDVDLIYPRRAYEMRTRGKVALQIFISDEGKVDEVNIIEATPPGIFEEAALNATLALQFTPGEKNGQRVRSRKTIEIAFDPYQSINIP
ncbi:MAG TPA: TonB family protein, partial [Burkholderiales bacterium]|nr:TonB family protein [Burkholderiales bacterium]